MKLKRITCLAAALVMAIGAALPVYADEEEERVIEEYWEDESKLTDDTSAPTLSFDLTDWKNTIHLTKDASLASLEAKQETDTAYQGQSLKLTVSSAKDITDLQQFSWLIRDDNNELVYPESENEDAEFLTIGVELHANEFGMNYFDGSMITFYYRINPDAKDLLMGDSCFIYACDDDYNKLDSTEFRMQYNDTDNNNTTQYAKGIMSVATDIGASKLVIDVPLQKATDKIDILYLDNFTVTTRSDKQVANLDGYNANAKPQEIVQGLKVKKKDNTVSLSDKSESDKSSGNVILYIGIGVVAVVVVVAIIIVIRKAKNRFY
ncbi:MAG: hypothetical protein Q4E74_06275 [Ruminococcus sp.]|nr:hypothetical protein [Ruminococcus sp.]